MFHCSTAILLLSSPWGRKLVKVFRPEFFYFFYLWWGLWSWWTKCWIAKRRKVSGRWRRIGCGGATCRCSSATRRWSPGRRQWRHRHTDHRLPPGLELPVEWVWPQSRSTACGSAPADDCLVIYDQTVRDSDSLRPIGHSDTHQMLQREISLVLNLIKL